jgi:hypothetical protein
MYTMIIRIFFLTLMLSASGMAAVDSVSNWSEPQDGILDPSEILLAAKSEAEKHIQYDPKKYGPGFHQAIPADPLLVFFDIEKTYYYLVVFEKDNATTAKMHIDAKSGELIAVTFIQMPGQTLSKVLQPKSVLEFIDGMVVNLPNGKKLTLSAATTTYDQTLLWTHSRASGTPFRPFYRLMEGGETVFLRVDGSIYPRI